MRTAQGSRCSRSLYERAGGRRLMAQLHETRRGQSSLAVKPRRLPPELLSHPRRPALPAVGRKKDALTVTASPLKFNLPSRVALLWPFFALAPAPRNSRSLTSQLPPPPPPSPFTPSPALSQPKPLYYLLAWPLNTRKSSLCSLLPESSCLVAAHAIPHHGLLYRQAPHLPIQLLLAQPRRRAPKGRSQVVSHHRRSCARKQRPKTLAVQTVEQISKPRSLCFTTPPRQRP